MKILKFGQSTLKDEKSFNRVIETISGQAKKKQDLHVIISALYKVPERLEKISALAMVGDDQYKPIFKKIEDEHFDIAKKFIDVKRQAKVLAHLKVLLNDLEEILYGVYLLWELSPRTLDHIHGYGIKLSAFLLAECLKEKNIEAEYVDSQKLIITNSNYGNASVDFVVTEKKIKQYFSKTKKIAIVTGQIGATEKGESTRLGKAGSSLSTAILASVLEAESIEIFTDRDGITNADVELVPSAFSLAALSYAEAMELSNFGTNVIYPPSLQPAFAKEIPITLKNLYNPDFKGTVIQKKVKTEKLPIKASSSIQKISLLNIQGSGMVGVAGVAGRVFSSLATNSISVILITQASSEHSITLAIKPEQGEKACDVLKKEFADEIKSQKLDKIALKENMSILAVIGDNMQQTPGISGKVFSALGNEGINISAIAQGSSELNISIVLEEKDLKKALNIIQKAFFDKNDK
jgi:aspartokinase/homoserine dehydrogenase 1